MFRSIRSARVAIVVCLAIACHASLGAGTAHAGSTLYLSSFKSVCSPWFANADLGALGYCVRTKTTGTDCLIFPTAQEAWYTARFSRTRKAIFYGFGWAACSGGRNGWAAAQGSRSIDTTPLSDEGKLVAMSL